MIDIVPTEFYLGQNFPNPFKEKTTIKYCVAYKTRVKITVYNTKGEMIEKLVDEEKNVGTYKIEFNHTSGNRHLGPGTYYYQLKVGNYKAEKEMTIIK